ncbi:acyl carrier protein [Amycolatopsis pigmentata]|uniref:Acyl carrier protein n=1 Tax=Amycolatopsis pigmentata TaxID=450801 RepID=A0ABW5FYS5_9PSEU
MTRTYEVPTAEGMIAWLTGAVARYAERPEAEIDPDAPLSDYGLDSVAAFAVITEIEDAFDVLPDVTVVWDYPSIRKLASFLTDLIRSERE